MARTFGPSPLASLGFNEGVLVERAKNGYVLRSDLGIEVCTKPGEAFFRLAVLLGLNVSYYDCGGPLPALGEFPADNFTDVIAFRKVE